MLTRLRIKNFKRFIDVDIPLEGSVVLIGPNNSGKTTVLQALTLWDIGLQRWNEKYKHKETPEKRPGITINRRDLVSTPIPYARLLWHDLNVRNVMRMQDGENTKQKTENIRMDIIVDGITNGQAWSCGFEFDYANEESFYCRPLRTDNEGKSRMIVPKEAEGVKVAFLPPMSGLADREYEKQTGEISVLIGQGQTAQVLRNLCNTIYKKKDSNCWQELIADIYKLFGVTLIPPTLIPARSEISMAYKDERGNELDLSSSGRGLQQILLLLAYLYSNPNTVLLLDEPDAHLEILRQRETYNLLITVAERQNSQIIVASHSEVVLNEAAGRDTVVAFVGKPHRMDERSSQVMKALRDIGFDQYSQAEQTGWVLYLEGSTDLAILQTFAEVLDHPARKYLERPFVYYVINQPQKACDHFYGLREAKADLVGLAIFDNLDQELQSRDFFVQTMWRRREIENYFCNEKVLLEYATYDQPNDLFGMHESANRQNTMRQSIDEVTKLLEIDEKEPWSPDVKASDEVLDRVFRLFFKKLKLPLTLRKSDYHILAGLMSKEELDNEITEKLDAIVDIAKTAVPRTE